MNGGIDFTELNRKLMALQIQRQQENPQADDQNQSVQQQTIQYQIQQEDNKTTKTQDSFEETHGKHYSNINSQQQLLNEDRKKNLSKVKSNLSRKNLFFANQNISIKDLEIFSTLGTGTFGRVKQVKLKTDSTGQYFALKMMKKTEIVKLKQVDHIKSEKNILLEIKHPFLVDLKTTFQDEKYIYMLFELVQGGELFTRLRKDGRFSNDISLYYISEIYTALHYLHQRNIVYRDLKPENLLIDKEGHVKIADFGFAKRMEHSRTYTLCGTPEYLAPEIIQGAKVGYGKSVDWWALGVLIFEMLSGHPPFYDNDPMGIYKKILSSLIEFPLFFSLRAKDIIRKLLNPIVEKRLGCQDDGYSVRKHKWFRGVQWENVINKEIPPPWIPFLKNDADISWFEKYPESRTEARQLPIDLEYLFLDF